MLVKESSQLDPQIQCNHSRNPRWYFVEIDILRVFKNLYRNVNQNYLSIISKKKMDNFLYQISLFNIKLY